MNNNRKVIHEDEDNGIYFIKAENDYIIEERDSKNETIYTMRFSEWCAITHNVIQDSILFQWILYVASTFKDPFRAKVYADFAIDEFFLLFEYDE